MYDRADLVFFCRCDQQKFQKNRSADQILSSESHFQTNRQALKLRIRLIKGSTEFRAILKFISQLLTSKIVKHHIISIVYKRGKNRSLFH